MARRVGHETVLKAKAAVKSFEAVRAYVRTMIAARRENFADDVIGHSFAVEPNEAPPLKTRFSRTACFSFMQEPGTCLLPSRMRCLLCCNIPNNSLVSAGIRSPITIAVEELLRYETPIQVSLRGVPEEIEFAGRRIGPKQLLVLLLGAANRDPEQFADPDRLDLTRRPNRHVSFGVGPHGCVGAWMARFGLAIAIGAILHRQTDLQLKHPGSYDWNFPAMRRTVRALPVLVDRRLRNSQRPSRLRNSRLFSPRPTRARFRSRCSSSQ